MGASMAELLKVSGFSGIEVNKDLNNRERIVKGILNG
jgi:hypothetical protein